MADRNHKMPRAIRISRKLALSSEKLVVMSGGEAAEPGGDAAEPGAKCTLLKTGCPAHTC